MINNLKNISISIFAITLLSIGCKKEESPTGQEENLISCRGPYLDNDSQGAPRMINEYYAEWAKVCIKDNMITPRWFTSVFEREKKKIKCSPQSVFPSMSLKASGNYYKYRDDRVYLDLNAETGEFRRIILEENKEGKVIFQRQMGCYYLREDFETEPVNPKDYGTQLLLDLADSSSSVILTPLEIFKINQSDFDHFEMWRFDDNSDVGWTFCSEHTPTEYCTELRNGNIFYYPNNLSDEVKTKLKSQAILMRSEFNFIKVSSEEFEDLWNRLEDDFLEKGLNIYGQENLSIYTTVFTVDEPRFTSAWWRSYLREEVDYMPDVDSSQTIRICYPASKKEFLPNGDWVIIRGKACYEDGEYFFE